MSHLQTLAGALAEDAHAEDWAPASSVNEDEDGDVMEQAELDSDGQVGPFRECIVDVGPGGLECKLTWRDFAV